MTLTLGPIEQQLRERAQSQPQLLLLIDPDDRGRALAEQLQSLPESLMPDAWLVGGSMLHNGHSSEVVQALRPTKTPVLLFPGDAGQLCDDADGILFHTLLSGRNSQYLIGEQVKAAPRVFAAGLECLPTAYMLVESERLTSAHYISATMPLPRCAPELAAAHALAARALGLRLLYLDAGSGAPEPVAADMIRAVREVWPGLLLVGGGLRTCEDLCVACRAGADAVVVGTALEEEQDLPLLIDRIRAFRQALIECRHEA